MSSFGYTSNNFSSHPNMNSEEFFSYIVTNYSIKFATFVCEELHIAKPSVLITLSLKDIIQLSRAIYPNIKSDNIEYYIGDHADKNSIHELKMSIITMLQQLKQELTPRKSKRRGGQTTSTTETDINSDNDKENRRKKPKITSPIDKLMHKRRFRTGQTSKHSERNGGGEWSFSSDEDYKPPLLGQLYPPSIISTQDRADFELFTIGRLDYFCQRYLHLSTVTPIRTFQHRVQVELGMHRENLYEFFRYIRHKSDLLNSIEDVAKNSIHEEESTKIKLLIKELVDIRTRSNFVNVGYEPK